MRTLDPSYDSSVSSAASGKAMLPTDDPSYDPYAGV